MISAFPWHADGNGEKVVDRGTKGLTRLNMELKAARPANWVVSKFMCK